jgi:cytochrome c peroxidase
MKAVPFYLSALLLWTASCGKVRHTETSQGAEPITIRSITIPATNVVEILKLSPLPELPPNPTNQYADNKDAALLGQHLFFDFRLSANGEISCATCHQAETNWTDQKPVSEGLETVSRNAPTLWNVAYQRWYFWDGRKDTLWSQALGPMEHPKEMGGSRLRSFLLIQSTEVYRSLYDKAFGPLPLLTSTPDSKDARPVAEDPSDPMQQDWQTLKESDQEALNLVFSHIGKSMEAYQRQIISTDAPFDRFVDALRNDRKEAGKHLSDAAIRGMVLFTGRGQCILCHIDSNFTDNEFHNIGLDRGSRPLDQGRYPAIQQVKTDPFNGQGAYSDDTTLEANQALHYVAPKDNNLGEFKTPTLRNIAKTAPYMHDGRFKTLREVLEFYSTLPDTPAIGHREESLQALNLTEQELNDLEAFLTSLTGAPLNERLLKAPENP